MKNGNKILMKFILQTLFYFIILLIYCICSAILDMDKGTLFIMSFNGESKMSISNMITTLESCAVTQPEQPVYDNLGVKQTYAQLKRDSDAIASYIDSLNLPARSPILVFGGQEYEMLATFVG
ncbi:hypothetical protein Hs30E_17590 [Lactococcus hodotermopsidis]|uniref:Uncharacterized protein n=1 Tax=Pseudolactococcus hodotermopsidis TaxID=2709157 RepID=A0A6A0BFT5_9LACT|nr:hypothetical protein Hs30E_17590 [Lactococcus hodotermopsidis]